MVEAERSILVVDDDCDACRNLFDILSDLGYRVVTAHSGPEALDLIRRQEFDLALLDLKMPGMDGLTLYRQLKQISSSTVAIIMTAYINEATSDEARQAGTWKVLSKPVDLSVLLPFVDEALSQPLVLVVDDDQELCASLWDLLRERGYRVHLAHDADEGVALVGKRDFSVVLLDLKLRDKSGHEVFQMLHDARPEARTILITAHRAEFESLIPRVLEEGADSVCFKPFDLDQLLRAIHQLAAAR